MTRSTAYAYEVVITTEDEHTITIKFESLDELSKNEQKEKAAQIFLAVYDDVETGMADMEVKPISDVLIDTETDGTTTYTTKAYRPRG
jgi:hypothetical protein